jgi:hypothetical protein
MRLDDQGYEVLVTRLTEKGYRKTIAGIRKADHYWYKTFRREDPENDRGYQIIWNIYDWNKYPGHRIERYGIEFEMSMNHRTCMDFDKCDIMIMRDDMDVEEFEGYCEGIYDALLKMLPKRKPDEPEGGVQAG